MSNIKKVTEFEKEFLLDLVNKYKSIVENKEFKLTEVKSIVWEKITKEFNEEQLCSPKTNAQLRKCWANMKARARKSCLDSLYRSTTNGQPPEIQRREYVKIMHMLPEHFVDIRESIENGDLLSHLKGNSTFEMSMNSLNPPIEYVNYTERERDHISARSAIPSDFISPQMESWQCNSDSMMEPVSCERQPNQRQEIMITETHSISENPSQFTHDQIFGSKAPNSTTISISSSAVESFGLSGRDRDQIIQTNSIDASKVSNELTSSATSKCSNRDANDVVMATRPDAQGVSGTIRTLDLSDSKNDQNDAIGSLRTVDCPDRERDLIVVKVEEDEDEDEDVIEVMEDSAETNSSDRSPNITNCLMPEKPINVVDSKNCKIPSIIEAKHLKMTTDENASKRSSVSAPNRTLQDSSISVPNSRACTSAPVNPTQHSHTLPANNGMLHYSQNSTTDRTMELSQSSSKSQNPTQLGELDNRTHQQMKIQILQDKIKFQAEEHRKKMSLLSKQITQAEHEHELRMYYLKLKLEKLKEYQS